MNPLDWSLIAGPLPVILLVSALLALAWLVAGRNASAYGSLWRGMSGGRSDGAASVRWLAICVPLIMMTAVYQALQSQNQYGDQVTYRMNGDIAVNGYPSVHMHNMFSSNDTAESSVLAAMNLGEHFGRIFENPYTMPGINGLNLDFDVTPERRAAPLETARTDVTEARPGDEITVEAVLRPYPPSSETYRQLPVPVAQFC